MSFTLAIVGRPNVGKSTLFNRLVGRRLALVDDQPGVTRDRREGEGRLYELEFRVVDTAGLEDATGESLEARMRRQTETAIAEADVVLFLIDARAGITPVDRHFADLLRRNAVRVIVVANKCEGRAAEAGVMEAYGLGLGEPVALSAEHGLGMADLHEAVLAILAQAQPGPASPGAATDTAAEAGEAPEVLQLAIVGRPNVGKSTLVNRLIGEERLLTGPEAGITRDAIAVEWNHKDRPLRLIDTAGLRRKAKVSQKVEKLSTADTLRAVKYAQVVVLLIDGELGLEKQDLAIASHVVDEGRALVIAVNKWDVIKDKQAVLRQVRDRLTRSLPQVRGLPVVPVSALEGRGLDRLLDAVFRAYDVWNVRLPTAELNRWLAAAQAAHPPPMVDGRRLRLKYITQPKARPPSFAVFCTRPGAVPGAYLRYLENALRDDFDLPGTPIRIHLRKGRNPYAA